MAELHASAFAAGCDEYQFSWFHGMIYVGEGNKQGRYVTQDKPTLNCLKSKPASYGELCDEQLQQPLPRTQ